MLIKRLPDFLLKNWSALSGSAFAWNFAESDANIWGGALFSRTIPLAKAGRMQGNAMQNEVIAFNPEHGALRNRFYHTTIPDLWSLFGTATLAIVIPSCRHNEDFTAGSEINRSINPDRIGSNFP